MDDIQLWMQKENTYKGKFSSKNTWDQIWESTTQYSWSTSVWFTHATPQYALLMWLAIQGRLTTGERIARWCTNINTTCVLCQATMETLNHLFFSCGYAAQVWCPLMRGLTGDDYSMHRNIIKTLVKDSTYNHIRLFRIQYVFQETVQWIWWHEWNGHRHRHGTKLSLPLVLERQPRF